MKKGTTNKKRRGTTEKQMKKGVRGKPENPSVVPKNGKPKEGRTQKNTGKKGGWEYPENPSMIPVS